MTRPPLRRGGKFLVDTLGYLLLYGPKKKKSIVVRFYGLENCLFWDGFNVI